MLVKDYMTRHPVMVEPETSIVEAQRIMGENEVRHLPVVGKGKRLLGLVTRQVLMLEPGKLGSLDVWEISRYLSRLTVKDVMVPGKDVITVDPSVTIEDAARIMVEKKIGCLPVIDDGVVVGIITETDMLAQLMEMMGSNIPGSRVTIRMPTKVRGELKKLVAVIGEQGWGILALGGMTNPKNPEKWDTVVKIRGVSKEEVMSALGQLEGQEIIDVRETP